MEEKDRPDDLMKQEETYWQQRAKAFWLSEGDTNSKFFHAQASVRRKFNHIAFLKNENDEIIKNHDNLCEMAVNYFKDIFNSDRAEDVVYDDSEDRIINPLMLQVVCQMVSTAI